jgi:hypothetical protein
MPRRWLACVLALSVVFGLASISSAKPPDLPQNERIIVEAQEPGYAPADPQLPVPLGSTRPEGGKGFISYQYAGAFVVFDGTVKLPETSDLQSYLKLPNAIPPLDPAMLQYRPFLAGLALLGMNPIQMVNLSPAGGEEACEDDDPEAMRCLPVEEETEEPARAPEKLSCMPKEDTKAQGSVCPYVRKQMAEQTSRFLPPCAVRSVLDNLKTLEKAAQVLKEAKHLAHDGKTDEAIECLEGVKQMCPGSSYEKRAAELIDQIHQAEEQQASQGGGCCCCPLGCMNHFGMCWVGQVLDWMFSDTVKAPAGAEQAQDVAPSVSVDEPIPLPCPPGCPMEALQEQIKQMEVLQERMRHECLPPGHEPPTCITSGPFGYSGQSVSAHFQQTPLGMVLGNLHGSIEVRIDIAGVDQASASMATPVTVHVNGVPMQVLLEQLLRPLHLKAVMHGNVVTITRDGDSQCQVNSEVQESSCPKMCGSSVCPKCELLHAQHAGKCEMVNGLMKACYLAFGEGRYEKAVDLARQAHAVDPARVEADPLVYKMHLLGQCCPKKDCKTTTDVVPPGGECEEQEAVGADGCVLVPRMPGLFLDLADAMDAALTGADGLGKAKKPQPK